MADPELLGPLRALASLLPEASGIASEHLNKVNAQLSKIEHDALQKFRDAGDKCLEKLTGHSILLLQRVLAGTRAVAAGRRDIVETDDGKAQSVYELLEKFDVDKDGVLSRKEFIEAAKTLLGDAFKVTELEKLANEVDKNKDGSVDVHEFTVWLYGAMASDSPQQKPKPQPKAPEVVAGGNDAAVVEELRKKLDAVQAELDAKARALVKMEERHEIEVDASLDFWRNIAKNSIMTVDKKIDLDTHEWLGNGKFGFVLGAVRRSDRREVVVKMMGLRWAHLAIKEYQFGSTLGKSPSIVEYDDVMLHNDDSKSFEKLLKVGYETGKLKSRQKRSQFPDRYVCLTQELMNRGTVQDWMNHGNLLPGGILCVMKTVASALAFMHKKGVTHNDIKPENVMCHQDNPQDEHSEVIVKLGDLGCADMSTDRVADYWQYGMTVFCMVTGEKFGSRKYMKESVPQFCSECATAITAAGNAGTLGAALSKVPDIMQQVFPQEMTFQQLSTHEALEGWTFFDGEGKLEEDDGSHSLKPRYIKKHTGKIKDATTRRACYGMDED